LAGYGAAAPTFRLFACAVGLNLLLFLVALTWHAPVWATNDDYRMSVILSGAYLGEPSPDAVFLQIPLGVLLCGLYRLFPALPVYGLYTEIAMFVSCCVFCYAILEGTCRRGRMGPGLILYLALYAVALRKYVLMPQFTLTSAYMGIAAAVLVHRLPRSGTPTGCALGAAALSLFSFLTRAKAFYLLAPVIGVIMLWPALARRRVCRGHALYAALTAVAILASLGAQHVHEQRPEYAAYRAFNTARSRVYDYGQIPFFYDDVEFYLSSGIDETLYRQIAARYLDMGVDADMLNAVADRIAETTTGSEPVARRIAAAFTGSLDSWLSSTDQTVSYAAALVLLLLAAYAALALRSPAGAGPRGLFVVILAGLFLENMYFLFIGRLMTRQKDMLLIAAAVLGVIMTIDEAPPIARAAPVRRRKPPTARLCRFLAMAAGVFMAVSCVAGAVSAVNANYRASLSRNARLDALRAYASGTPDIFYFYDAQDFIAATDDVFSVYDASRPANIESLGNWNVKSPTYHARNAKWGFESAIDGLALRDDVRFVSVAAPKMAATRTLKDGYNKELRLVERIQAKNCILSVYMAVDAD